MKLSSKLILGGTVLSLASFSLGAFAVYKSRVDKFAFALVAYSELLEMDQHSDAKNLIDIYSKIHENHDDGMEYLQRLIIFSYAEDAGTSPFFAKSETQKEYEALHNQEVEDFIQQHPLEECAGVSSDELLQCNLENALNFD